MDTTLANVRAGQTALLDYFHRISSNRGLILKVHTSERTYLSPGHILYSQLLVCVCRSDLLDPRLLRGVLCDFLGLTSRVEQGRVSRVDASQTK